MKRLTINRVARAHIRHNRKAYFSLAVGIFLAVYLACCSVLCIWGTLEAKEEQMARRVGWGDTLLYGHPDITDDQLRDSGLFDQIGSICVTASVGDSKVYTGYYDETAQALMYRQCAEGRLPEAPGEIAAERSALDKLSLEDAAVGDTFTWTMKPFDGEAQERTFTLVGILTEQAAYLDPGDWYLSDYGVRLPDILTSPQEPPYPIGRMVIHRVMTNQPGVTLDRIQNVQDRAFAYCCAISRVTGKVDPIDNSQTENLLRSGQVLLWMLLSGALLLSACVAIASAMESMLARKAEDIGMLRAVGATLRQLRRLFGRDVWLLTLTALPLGVAMGCLTCWLLSMAAPQELVFRPAVWLLLPMVVITGLCVYLSSALPLRRASRQTPMGVLRDTAVLRRARRIRSRKAFRVPRLIAARQFALHPLRQTGSVLMAGLMLLVTILLGEALLLMDWQRLSCENAFTLTAGRNGGIVFEPFAQEQSEDDGLTDSDLQQLRSLPLVSEIERSRKVKAVLALPDPVPDYLKTYDVPIVYDDGRASFMEVCALEAVGDTYYLDVTEETSAADFADKWYYQSAMTNARQMRVLQQELGVQDKLVPVTILVATLDEADLAKNVTEGRIDLAALDAGREVLVYAPNLCAIATANGHMEMTCHYFDDELQQEQWDLILQNDFFASGQTLSLTQLWGIKPDWFNNSSDMGQMQRYYSGLARTSCAPRVGAILKGYLTVANTNLFSSCLMTTEKGAAALGLYTPGAENVSLTLSALPDADTEARLEDSIARIGMRRNAQPRNNLAARREIMRTQQRTLMLLSGMALLFFAVSVAMQVTNASRRIRADVRMVGTLRAVGADERTLLRCYGIPAVISAGFGYLLMAMVYGATVLLNISGFPNEHPWLLLALLPLAALNALCAAAGIRGQLRRVMGQSIIENIREL